MDMESDEAAARSLAAVPGGGGSDFLSRLPDHLLVDILLRLCTKDAVATTVLSRRWRAVWPGLPHLNFDGVDPSVPARALASYQDLAAFDIQRLAVSPNQVDAQETSAWLALAAPRLTGPLHLDISRALSEEALDDLLMADEVDDDDQEALEFPCFVRATEIRLDLAFLAPVLPPIGVFEALRSIFLHNFRCQGQIIFNDMVFPSLQHLTMNRARCLNVLINSNALVSVHLSYFMLLQQLAIMAPGLQQLEVLCCFYDAPIPVANITAESLEVLSWDGPYDAEFVHFGEMPCLWRLRAPPIFTLRWQEFQMAQICARFLNRFAAVNQLELHMSLGCAFEIELRCDEARSYCNMRFAHK
ncbi:unnamed protein product [Triticum turgidum subsp. durum]|uniref:F-box domain-containing protein n=1 Tax=Triticum turgidum subsp. durum TaxID=4567 RepID=A0A9R0YS14_TRITD|nr:unnamed protein product [Triticum turgidum subsp. durum]